MNAKSHGAKIGLFGGSFNPVHKAHFAMCEYLLRQRIVEQLWLIPTFQNPFKNLNSMLPTKLRLDLLTAMKEDLQSHGFKSVFISECEIQQKKTSNTFETLTFFKQQDPAADYWLVLGQDAYQSLPSWQRAAELLKVGQFLVFPRAGLKQSTALPATVQWLDFTPKHISASLLRTQPLALSHSLPEAAIPIWHQYWQKLSESQA